jgi:uncharacterized protein (DUF4415 family)
MTKSKDVSEKKPWVDPDDAPPWTEDQFRRAGIWEGDTLIRPADGTLTKPGPGRPKLAKPKQRITLRLDQDVIERFRATGAGWQSRMNEALRKAANV